MVRQEQAWGLSEEEHTGSVHVSADLCSWECQWVWPDLPIAQDQVGIWILT